MRRILVLGAGQSAGFLISHLLASAADRDWFVTVGDRDPGLAARRVDRHPRGAAISYDAADTEHTAAQVEAADVVLDFLPQRFQHALARACLQSGTHLISVSYRDREMDEMNEEARRRGVLLLTEVGLDPGIDHMSAIQALERVRAAGGVVEGFESYGAGLPSPEVEANPLRYCVTWNPRNVVMAGEDGAQYLKDGRVKLVPRHRVFAQTWSRQVPGIGPMEAYANRDSLRYRETFALNGTRTLIRGTLRYPGWGRLWQAIVKLGLPNETLSVPRLERLTWAELVDMFLPDDVPGKDLPARFARFADLEPRGETMRQLAWLGLFSDETCGDSAQSPTDALVGLFNRRLALPAGARDMVLLMHRIEARFPDRGDRRERRLAVMIHHGDPGGWTAMARSVGLPASLAARLLLAGELPLTGSHIPTHPAIYGPILGALEDEGIAFDEHIEALT